MSVCLENMREDTVILVHYILRAYNNFTSWKGNVGSVLHSILTFSYWTSVMIAENTAGISVMRHINRINLLKTEYLVINI
jgi:hypothetical protein